MSIHNNYLCFTNNPHSNVDNSLEIYRNAVANANKKLNLVSRYSVENSLNRLIKESLIPLDWNRCLLSSPLIDIGSGAGIPGIPLRVAKPDLKITLLEANRRKVLFIKSIIETLKLQNSEALNERAENICQYAQYQAYFGTIVSRAVCSLSKLMEWGNVLLRPGGELIVWKGSSVNSELEGIDLTGWKDPELLKKPNGLTLVRFEKRTAESGSLYIPEGNECE
ncbi:MAG: 16S rRNA (guanine(527)-N(7))-methyltransferase RsmG [Candidatus Hatepunaea meridiana]|nr:16S rRNA (guanine(527)-N(7))-methyltransferase RsmG [Candidatus Hatepunaea meridiana]